MINILVPEKTHPRRRTAITEINTAYDEKDWLTVLCASYNLEKPPSRSLALRIYRSWQRTHPSRFDFSTGFNSPITSLSLGDNGQYLLVGDQDGRVCIFDIGCPERYHVAGPMVVYHRHKTSVLAMALVGANLERIVSAARDEPAPCIWNGNNGETMIELPSGKSTAECFATTSSGLLLWLGGDGPLRRWDLTANQELIASQEGAPVAPLYAHSLTLSQDETRALVASSERLPSGSLGSALSVWDLATGTGKMLPVVTQHRPWNAVFSPDESSVLWSADHGGTIYRTNLDTGVIEDPFDRSMQVKPARFQRAFVAHSLLATPRKKRVFAASSHEHYVYLLDQQCGEILWDLRACCYVRALALSKDGTALAAGGTPGTLSVWRIPQGVL